MFDHVTIRVADRAASERFYTAAIAELGIEQAFSGEHFAEWGDFSLAAAHDESQVTTGLRIGFVASADGPARQDPDGNTFETVGERGKLRAGAIAQLRIVVADLDASSRFYEAIAPYAGIEIAARRPGKTAFASPRGGSLILVEDAEPTRNVHLAFPGGANATVDAFHAAALRAGYSDNGAPGERIIYHDGYYGAFVLDPDGNNVELVNHNR